MFFLSVKCILYSMEYLKVTQSYLLKIDWKQLESNFTKKASLSGFRSWTFNEKSCTSIFSECEDFISHKRKKSKSKISRAKYFMERRNRRTSSQQNYISQSTSVMRKQENRLTRISIGIVSLYIICHIWRILPTAYEALYSEDGTVLSHWPTWLIHVYHLSHTLIVTNSAINFLLYVVL